MPDSVDRIMLHDPGESPPSDFAMLVPITDDYSDLTFDVKNASNRERFANSFKRVFAFTLPYDRIIYLDADMLCVGEVSLLWSDKIGKLPWYACLDTAAQVYYPDRLAEAAMDPVRIFNGGLEILHPAMADGFYSAMLYRLRNKTLSMYDGADQGAVNSYWQFSGIETGILPPGYNYILDPNCPQVPEYHRRIIHFTGSQADPTISPGRNDPDKRQYYTAWLQEWKECGL
jgi:lipopolysaccharide biosynthesis glycosyltransferase